MSKEIITELNRAATISLAWRHLMKDAADRIAELEAQLRKYANHTEQCASNETDICGDPRRMNCNCGLDAAITALEATCDRFPDTSKTIRR